MNILSVKEFIELKQKDDFLLVDVREEYEYDELNIGGLNIPLAETLSQLDRINQHDKVVFICKSGKRSEAIAQTVERKTNHSGIYVLNGGLDAYFDKETHV